MRFPPRYPGFLAFLSLAFLVSALAVPLVSAVQLDPSVSTQLASNGSVRVIVALKPVASGQAGGPAAGSHVAVRAVSALGVPLSALSGEPGVNVTRRYSTLPLVSATIDSEGLATLAADPDVAGVYYDRPVYALDDGSNAQIHANSVQQSLFNSQNITGRNQTICIVDTGIDYRNPAFGSCSSVGSGGACRVVGGYDFVNLDADPLDDNKHGTHVAGIAAANGSGLTGVAPGAKLVALKVLNSAGSGSTSDVISGVDWCNANRTVFNITVISMSLGTPEVTSLFCDTDTIALSVQSAFSNGISVPIASGNGGFTNGTSSPACSSNATAVGSVSDDDVPAPSSNDWSNLLVFAPGVSINSTTLNNNTQKLSGTSMATPHVAGLYALLQDFVQAANGSLATPTYVRALINRTGVAVNNTNVAGGRIHYRIDAMAAFQTLQAEVSPRNISLVSFTNASVTTFTYSFVNFTFADDNMTPSACLLEWSNGSLANFSMTAANGSCSINMTNQVNVNASMRFYVNDSFGNLANASFVRSHDTLAPRQILANVSNNSAISATTVLLNVSFSDLNGDSCVLQLDGTNFTAASTSQYCLFTRSVSVGSHNLTAYANDTLGRLNQSGFYFFSVDTTFPTGLSLVSPAANNTNFTTNYTFVNFTFTEANPGNCILQYGNATGTANFTMALVDDAGTTGACSFNVTSNFTNATGQTHNFTVFVNDSAGNINGSGVYFVTHDSTRPNSINPAASSRTNNSFSNENYTFVNFTFSESNPANCILQYGNATGTANFTMALVNNANGADACSFNVTGNFTNATSQTHNFTVFVNDSAGNVNASAPTFVTHDAVAPASLSFVSPTPSNASFTRANYVFVNLSFVESNPSACILQFNSSANFSMALAGASSGVPSCSFNVTGLSDSTQNFSVFLNDSTGSSATSGVRTASFDVNAPTILAVNASRLFFNTSGPLVVSANASDSLASNLNVSLLWVNASGIQRTDTSPSLSGTNYSFNVTNLLGISDGNYTLNLSVQDNASNSASNASINVTLDSVAPSAPFAAINVNASGFIQVNWTASTDAVSFDHYEVIRNGTFRASTTNVIYTDNSVFPGFTYSYSISALDSAGNSNSSNTVQAVANDTVIPRQSANLTATNLGNGSVNLSWTNVTADSAGFLEFNVTYRLYRSDNLSSTNLSNMTLLGNTSVLYFEDDASLNASTTYRYVVSSLDANNNQNTSIVAANSLNQTTLSSCTNDFSAFSACSGGSQSHTRVCFGQTETQSQSCTSGSSGGSGGSGGGGGSGGSGGSSGGSAGGGTSSPSSGGAHGGGGGPGNLLFVVQKIPDALEIEPGKSTSVTAEVSSFYTGYLRVNNLSISGVPDDWYDLPNLTVVTPISKTNFSINWHPPADARGNYTVVLSIVGVGTKNAGLLNTSFNFTLVLPPAKSVQSSGASSTGSGPVVQAVPTAVPSAVPESGGLELPSYMLGLFILVVGVVGMGLWKWRALKKAPELVQGKGAEKVPAIKTGRKDGR